MAAVWTARLDSVQEVDNRAIIDATIIKTDGANVREWPYHVEYNDVSLMTLSQVQTDVLNTARDLASKGAAIAALKIKVGQTFPLAV